MFKDVEVKDEESGITLKYIWDEKTGWSFIGSGYSSREERRKAVKSSLKYWPEIPEEHKERIDKNNKDILEFTRGFKHDE
jgi:hypothetical protein